MKESVSHCSVELNILGDKQCLTFILLDVTVFGNVAVSWRESSCWLSLLKPFFLLDWWSAPKQVLHKISSGHIFRKELGVCHTKDLDHTYRKWFFPALVGRVKLPIIWVDSILASFQEGGLFEGVIRRCAFAVTDQRLIWNGKEDFSEGLDVF